MATARRPPGSAYQRALERARQLGPAATIEVHDAHQDGGRRHYHVYLNGRQVAGPFPFGAPVRQAARELEAEDEALGEAEGIGSIVEQIAHSFPTSALPPELKRQLLTQARMIYNVRGALLARLMATVYGLIGARNLPPMAALRLGAQQLNLQPRGAASGGRSGMSGQQVRQYHRRQEQRGRRPGQNPQMRSRRQREAELMVAAAPPLTQAEAELETLLGRVDRAMDRVAGEAMAGPRRRIAMSSAGGGPYRTPATPPPPAQVAARLTRAANRLERGARQLVGSFSQAAQDEYFAALDQFCQEYLALSGYLSVVSPRLRQRVQRLAQRFC